MKRFAIFLLCCLFVVSSATAGPPGSPIGGAGGGGSGDMTKAVYDSGDDGVVDSAIATAVQDNLVVNADINSSAAIDATKIADGTVTSTEFQYLNDVTSAVQVQIDSKAPLVSPSFTTPSLGVATATTLNTGQGAYELYAMDQNVQTTDNVVVNKLTATEGVVVGQSTDPGYTRLYEGSANGTNYVEHIAEADLGAGNTTVTWGESQVDFGALNLLTTGAISGGVSPFSLADNTTLTRGTHRMSAAIAVTAARTITLPEVVASGPTADQVTPGAVYCFQAIGAVVVDVKPHANDGIILSGGTRDTNGDAIYSDGVAGSMVCVVADSASGYMTWGKGGTWAAR